MFSLHCSPNGNTSCSRQGTEHYLLALPKIHVKSATLCYETCLTITCDFDPESNVSLQCDYSNRATWNKVDQSERNGTNPKVAGSYGSLRNLSNFFQLLFIFDPHCKNCLTHEQKREKPRRAELSDIRRTHFFS